MASEFEQSILDQSIDTLETESLGSTLPIRRKKSSPIHEHTRTKEPYEPERDQNGNIIYYCRYCPSKSSSTSGLRSHLKSKHDIDSASSVQARTKNTQDSISTLYSRLMSENAAENLNQEVLKRTINEKMINQTLLDLIIVRKLPFRIGEWPEFRTFCAALNPESIPFIPSSHTTISKKIQDSLPEAKDIVRKALQSAKTSIHLAVDIWTSPNRYLLLAVCGTFVDINDQFWNILLALRPTYGHSGETQWNTLQPILEEYGILEKIGTVIGDNSGTNDTLCRSISQFLAEEKRIDWHPTQQRIRCQGHILNLVVQAFFFQSDEEAVLESYDQQDSEDTELSERGEKDRGNFIRNKLGVLGKLHNIVSHIRSSAIRTQEFKKAAQRLIPMDNRTKWNSWYTMLKVSLEEKIKISVQQYIEKHLKEGTIDKIDVLSMDDWIQLRMIASFLEPFENATLEMQGKEPTLGRVLESMDLLHDHFDEYLINKNFKLHHIRVQRSYAKFLTYVERLRLSPYYAAARILHPERRTTWQKDESGEWLSTEDEQMNWKVKQLWERFRKNLPPSSLPSHEQTSNENISSAEPVEELSSLQKLRQKRRERGRPQSQDEYDSYCAESPSYNIQPLTPLQWWAQEVQQLRFPQLSRFAFEILSIPAMSDKPERVFSGGRRTISWDRASISMEAVEAVECLKDWKVQGILFKEF